MEEKKTCCFLVRLVSHQRHRHTCNHDIHAHIIGSGRGCERTFNELFCCYNMPERSGFLFRDR